MSEGDLELIRRVLEAWSRRDLDEFLSCFDPACEVVFSPNVPEPGPFHGRDELRGWAEGFTSAWEQQKADIEEAESAQGDLYVLVRTTSHGAGSGIEDVATFPFVFTVRNGLITRWRGFVDGDEARQAAGLAP
jgi:ketosteroid isomerase-like protein